MVQEMVDILDEQGRVVGLATRREMRVGRLPHRCVYLVVFNGKGEIFIHQRTSTKDVFPSYWDMCAGGVVSSGEDFYQGALREGREELGVELQPKFLFPFRYEDDKTVVFAEVFRCEHEGPFRLQPEEVVQGEFVALSRLKELIQEKPFCPDGLQVLEKLIAMGMVDL